MKAVIIEDEQSAVHNLELLLQSVAPDIEIVESIDTVIDAIAFFNTTQRVDLVFLDIHLADGNSFDIFGEVQPAAPIIFTTAYDQYAIKAFKLNSIDYLLKPVREEELKKALDKFKAAKASSETEIPQIKQLFKLLQQPPKSFRQSYLVQKGDTLIPLASKNFAFFYIQNGVVRGTTMDNSTYIFSEKLEDLETELDPSLFFRANRQYLIQRSAIKNLELYFNGRLIVNLLPTTRDQIIVSKANASKIKAWLKSF